MTQLAAGQELSRGRILLRHVGVVRGVFLVAVTVLLAGLVIYSFVDRDPHERYKGTSVEIQRSSIPSRGVPGAGFRVYGGPSLQHVLGTDERGRDLLIRLAHGARTSMMAGVICTLCFVVFGVSFGVASGYLEGPWRAVSVYLFNLVNNFPILLLLLLSVIIVDGIVDSSWRFLRAYLLMALLGVFSSPKLSELIRGRIASLKESAFVQASVALGLSPTTIVVKHILWLECRPLIFVQAAYMVGQAILIETTLTYLNFGLEYPSISWGLMIRTMASGFFVGESSVLIVVVTMAVAVFYFQTLAAALNDALRTERG